MLDQWDAGLTNQKQTMFSQETYRQAISMHTNYDLFHVNSFVQTTKPNFPYRRFGYKLYLLLQGHLLHHRDMNIT